MGTKVGRVCSLPLHLTVILLALVLTRLPAQDEPIEWVPLDVPQLNRNELRWVDAITLQGTGEGQEQAIIFFEEKIQDGQVSAGDRASILVLERIIAGPWQEISTPAIRSLEGSANAITRARAVNLLSHLGGEYSIESLDRLLLLEEDASVLSGIFAAYAEIAPAFNSYRLEHFARHLRHAAFISREPQLVLSILAAVESMHQQHWNMNDRELFSAILDVSSAGFGQVLNMRAASLARFIAGIE